MDVIHFPAVKRSPPLSLNLPLLNYQDTLHSTPSHHQIQNLSFGGFSTLLPARPQKWWTANCLVTIYHIGVRKEEERVMKCPTTTPLEPDAATARRMEPLVFCRRLGFRCSRDDLGDLALPPLPWKHQMQWALTQSWSRLELLTDKQGRGRKVNEKARRVQGYFWLCLGFTCEWGEFLKNLRLLSSREGLLADSTTSPSWFLPAVRKWLLLVLTFIPELRFEISIQWDVCRGCSEDISHNAASLCL